jgi:hypothetical protein
MSGDIPGRRRNKLFRGGFSTRRAGFHCVYLLGFEGVQIGDRLVDSFQQFVNRCLVILVHGRLDAGETRSSALGHVGSNLHAPAKRKHVRRQPPVDQDRDIELLDFRIFRCLIQQTTYILQHTKHDRNRRLVHRNTHTLFLSNDLELNLPT